MRSFFESCVSEDVLFGMCMCNDASKDEPSDPPRELPRRRRRTRKESSKLRRRSEAPQETVKPAQRVVSLSQAPRRRRRSRLPAIIQTELFAKRFGFSRFVQARSKWPGSPGKTRRRSYAREDDMPLG